MNQKTPRCYLSVEIDIHSMKRVSKNIPFNDNVKINFKMDINNNDVVVELISNKWFDVYTVKQQILQEYNTYKTLSKLFGRRSGYFRYNKDKEEETNNLNILENVFKAIEHNGYHTLNIKHLINQNDSIIPILIGNKGSYFKYLTDKYGLNGIWYDKNSKEIEFWGDEKSFNQAKKKVEYKILSIIRNQNITRYQ